MDYLMPAKDMVAKMTCRRKYVIISEQPEPDYLDELEENLVLVSRVMGPKSLGKMPNSSIIVENYGFM